MNSRITKKRLFDNLAYDWIKIIILVIAVVLVWELAFTIGSPRATVGQQYELLVYGKNFYAINAGSILNEASEQGYFSYDVLDFMSRDLTDETYGTVMQAIFSIGECDSIIVDNSEQDVENNNSCFYSLVDNYGSNICDIDELINNGKYYCVSNGMVELVDGEYRLNDDKIYNHFVSRMKKDPRFKNQEKIDAGFEKEKLRIKTLWNNASKIEQVLQKNTQLRANYKRYTQTLNNKEDIKSNYLEQYESAFEKEKECTYGINLGFLTGGKQDITSVLKRSVTDEKGEVISENANDIILCIFDFTSLQPYLQYENLGLISYFIENYSNFYDCQFDNLIK